MTHTQKKMPVANCSMYIQRKGQVLDEQAGKNNGFLCCTSKSIEDTEGEETREW